MIPITWKLLNNKEKNKKKSWMKIWYLFYDSYFMIINSFKFLITINFLKFDINFIIKCLSKIKLSSLIR